MATIASLVVQVEAHIGGLQSGVEKSIGYLTNLEGATGKATKGLDSMMAGMNASGHAASASGKLIAGMSQSGLEALARSTKDVIPPLNLAAGATKLLTSAFGQFTLAGLAVSALQKLGAGVMEFAALGARLPAVERSFQRLTEGIEQNAEAMLAAMRAATSGLVSDFDLMQSANKAMLLGLPITAESMGELAKTAIVLGRAMGQDATKSLDDLITALGRSSPLILDNLGLTVKVGEANERYAEKLHTTVEQLTDVDKKMAFYEATMEAARKKTVELGEQTKTLGEFAESAWVQFGNAVTRAAAGFNTFIGKTITTSMLLDKTKVATKELEDSLKLAGAAAAAAGSGVALVAPLKVAIDIKAIDRALDDQEKTLDRVRKGAEKTAEQHKKFSDELTRSTDAARKNESGLFGLEDALGTLNTTELDAIKIWQAGYDALKKLEGQIREIEKQAWVAAFGFKGMSEGLEHLGTNSGDVESVRKHLELVAKEAKTTGESIRANLGAALEAIPGILTNAFTGGGGILGALKAIAVQIVNAIVQPMLAGLVQAAQAASGLGKSLTDAGNAGASGGAAAAGGLTAGSVAAAGFGAAIVGFVALWKKSMSEAEQMNALAQKWTATVLDFATAEQIATAKGDDWVLMQNVLTQAYLDTGRSVEQLIEDMRGFVRARVEGPDAMLAAVLKLTAAIDEQKQDAADLDAAIQKYGFSIEELGPTMRRQKLTEQALELMNHFRLLAGSGIDVDLVLRKMGGSINEFVLTALRTGTEVPASMAPMLEQAIAMGGILDENGVAFKDLKSTGLTFSETMTQGFDRVVKKFDELLLKIGLITKSVLGIPTHVVVAVEGVYHPPEIDGAAGVGERAASAAGRASGGFGSRGGAPLVLVRGGGSARAGTDLSGQTLAALQKLERTMADQDRRIALAVRTALATSRRAA